MHVADHIQKIANLLPISRGFLYEDSVILTSKEPRYAAATSPRAHRPPAVPTAPSNPPDPKLEREQSNPPSALFWYPKAVRRPMKVKSA